MVSVDGTTVFIYLPLSPLLNEAVTIELEVTPETVNACEALVLIVTVPAINPRFVLATEADEAPVPPSATAIAVPFQVPVPIVPKVVTFVEPTHVDKAVFSTSSRDKSYFNSDILLPSIPLAVNFAKSSSEAPPV